MSVGYIKDHLLSGIETSTETSDSKAVEHFEFKEDITLVGAGVTGILEEKKTSKIFGSLKIPGSDKSVLIQYRYQANLGIDGKEVTIKKTGDHSFDVDVPAFKMLGMKFTDQDGKGPFKTVSSEGGILSFVTADIDEAEMYSRVVTDDGAELINANIEQLRSQAESFFTGIITSVDPEAEIDFDFTEQPAAAK